MAPGQKGAQKPNPALGQKELTGLYRPATGKPLAGPTPSGPHVPFGEPDWPGQKGEVVVRPAGKAVADMRGPGGNLV